MQPLFISHRGESHDAPENTLPAFRLAIARDTDGMECDVRFSRDRRIVVAHDEHTGRMGDRLVSIRDTDFADLRSINVRGAFAETAFVQIPTLAEVLQELPEGKLLVVEIKPGQDPSLVAETGRTIQASGVAADQVVLISFDPDTVTRCKRLLPAHQALWLTGGTDPDRRPWTPGSLAAALKRMAADGVDIVADEPLLTPGFIHGLQAQGAIVAVWTVDGTEQARRLIGNGARIITSNRAAALMRQIR